MSQHKFELTAQCGPTNCGCLVGARCSAASSSWTPVTVHAADSRVTTQSRHTKVAAAVAPLHVVGADQVEDVRVVGCLVEVDLHELDWFGVDARHRLADVRQDVVQSVLLGPAQYEPACSGRQGQASA